MNIVDAYRRTRELSVRGCDLRYEPQDRRRAVERARPGTGASEHRRPGDRAITDVVCRLIEERVRHTQR
jgi:hypothetical protein